MPSPYYVDDLPAQCGVSGGRTSGYLAYHILQAHNWKRPDSLVFSFSNTGEECEETLEFLHEMETRWPLDLVWLEWHDTFNIEDYRKADGALSRNRLRGQDKAFRVVDYQTASRNGEPFEMLLAYYYQYRKALKPDENPHILPTLLTRMCTSHLKIKTAERYMASLGWKEHVRLPGIRYDELRRTGGRNSENTQYLLVDAKVARVEVNEFWAMMPFDLQLDKESIEGNCRHCFLKHPSKAIAIIKKMILRHGGVDAELQRWLDREARAGMFFRKDRPPFTELVQIAKDEISTGKSTEMDFSLVPDYSCNCAGTSGLEETF